MHLSKVVDGAGSEEHEGGDAREDFAMCEISTIFHFYNLKEDKQE
jgi:hypothetical protein